MECRCIEKSLVYRSSLGPSKREDCMCESIPPVFEVCTAWFAAGGNQMHVETCLTELPDIYDSKLICEKEPTFGEGK